MPVVFRHQGLRFFFYSNEGNPCEPVHIHVRGGDCEAKLWMQPVVRIDASVGFSAKAQRELIKLAEQHAVMILEAWNEHFTQGG